MDRERCRIVPDCFLGRDSGTPLPRVTKSRESLAEITGESLSLFSKIFYGLGNCLSERELIDAEPLPTALSGESRQLPYRG